MRRAEPGRCSECGTRKPISGLRLCAICRARKRVKRELSQSHDVLFLAAMLRACHDAASCCSATGRSLLALRKVGERLTVDRINPRRGYVAGNVQLLAGSLNEAKNNGTRTPQSALNRLLKKLDHVVEDILSDPYSAVQPV